MDMERVSSMRVELKIGIIIKGGEKEVLSYLPHHPPFLTIVCQVVIGSASWCSRNHMTTWETGENKLETNGVEIKVVVAILSASIG